MLRIDRPHNLPRDRFGRLADHCVEHVADVVGELLERRRLVDEQLDEVDREHYLDTIGGE